MADKVTVRAGWALWAKQPGTRQDYSVLACSPEPFSRSDFAAIITRFAVGSPDVNAAGPAALPWVTVSWVGVDNDPQLGISITSDTGQFDGVRRPITQTAYFCVPYTELARTPVSYCDLYDAVIAQVPSLRATDGPMISLTLPALSRDRLADTVRHSGEQAAAVAAALLLSRPVSVVQAEGASLRERLEFIDAVASLLPYGYRVRFSGATWADTGTRHRVRLAFAGRPAEGAAVMYWRRAAEVPAGDPVAAAYADRLRRLAQDPARTREGLGLPELIGRLAADADPLTFDKPHEAIDHLARIDKPFRLARAVRERIGVSVDDLRELFVFGRAKELRDETDVVALLTDFAGQAEARDWKQLRRDLDNLSRREDQARVLVAFGRRMLWAAPRDPGRAMECLRFAVDLGYGDPVLAGLICPLEEPGGQSADAQPAAQLLAEAVLASPGAGRGYPRAREVLLGNLALAAEFVLALSHDGGHAAGLLGWLDPQGTGVFTRAFRIALGIDEGWVSAADLGELDTAGRGDGVRLLLSAASRAGNLHKVLPEFTHWLGGSGELRNGGQDYWVTHLSGLVVSRNAQTQAWLDTALLMAGGLPSGLPPASWNPAARYADTMARTWADLSKAYQVFDAAGCAHALAGYLGEQPWTAQADQALSVVHLAERLVDFDRSGSLAKTVAARLTATPAAKDWEFAQAVLAWAARNEPGAVREQVLDSLASAKRGADPGELAGLCASACAAGIDAEVAFVQLANSAALVGAAQARDLHLALPPRFAAAGIDSEAAEAWQFAFAELAAQGGFGTGFLPELRALFSEQARRNIRTDLRLLAIFAEDAGDSSHEWTDAERADLTAMGAAIESMLKKARKFPRMKMRRPFGGGAPEEAAGGQVPVGEAGPGSGPGSMPTMQAHGADRSAGTVDTVPVPGPL